MQFSVTQLQALKADIALDGTLNPLFQGKTEDGAAVIAAAYNALATPDYFVWQTRVPIDAVLDAVTWANFTPQDAPDGTLTWQCRSLACQGKQFNLQTILLGKAFIDATKSNVRAGLQDCTTGLPSGAAGATKSGGWVAIQLILSRKASRAEKLFAAGAGTTAAPSLMGVEGVLTVQDVVAAWNS